MRQQQQIINKFIKGVNTDIAEDALPEGFLSNGHNIKLTNDDNKQGIVQKQENYISTLTGYPTTLVPLAASNFDDVLYIVSLRPDTKEVEIGTYPSADLSHMNNKPKYPKIQEYRALPNYATGHSPEEYLGDFVTAEFEYFIDSEVDIEIQQSYDSSVNIITTTKGHLPRIVNSRQEFMKDEVLIITRDGGNLDNVYSDATIDKTELLPNLKGLAPSLKFEGVRKQEGQLLNGGYKYYFKLATADGVESPIFEESRLVSIHEGDTFGDAATFLDLTQTSNAVEFSISGLNTKVYSTIQVYYMLTSGQIFPGVKSFFKIDKAYKIEDDGTCTVVHTGYETQIPVDSSIITAAYNPVDSVATLNQKNSRLLLGNIKTTNISDSIMRRSALKCFVESDLADLLDVSHNVDSDTTYVTDNTYAKPENIYYKVSYFPTETYELAINFVFENGAVSPAYPIMGFDFHQADMALQGKGFWKPEIGDEYPSSNPYINYYWDITNVDTALGYTFVDGDLMGQTVYNTDRIQFNGSSWQIGTLGNPMPVNKLTMNNSEYEYPLAWFDPTYIDDENSPYRIQNTAGVVRMKDYKMQDAAFIDEATSRIDAVHVKTMAINVSEMISGFGNSLKDLGIITYFISRRAREADMISEGLLAPTASAPISSMSDEGSTVCTLGQYQGYGWDGELSDNLIHFPMPGNAVQFSSEAVIAIDEWDDGGDIKQEALHTNYSFDGVQFAPSIDTALQTKTAFYSPDITSDTSVAAAMNMQSDFSIHMDSIITSDIEHKLVDIVPVYNNQGATKLAYHSYASSFTDYAVDDGDVLRSISYVDDGMRSFSSGSFTARLDRQNFLLLYNILRSKAQYGAVDPNSTSAPQDIVIDKQWQADFSVTALNLDDPNNINKYYVLLERMIKDSTQVPREGGAGLYAQNLGSGIKFSPYLGLELDAASLIQFLTIDSGVWFTAYANNDEQVPDVIDEVPLGAYVKLYNNNNKNALPIDKWISKYQISRPSLYFAISNRFAMDHDLTDEEKKLHGGDCYTGLYTQRVWRPAGIDGIPTASNALAYSIEGDDGSGNLIYSREGLNITNSGYAITFPVRSKYNFAIRAIENADSYESPSEELVAEASLFGKGRHYPSNYPIDEVSGNRQAESSVINYGNIIESSVIQTAQFDDAIPYSKIEYPNRLLVSEIAITGEFTNGFRNFKNINFKDYDEELGYLVSMVSRGVYTYLVFTNGVSMIEVEERAAINDETGANIYIASSTVLPPKSAPIFTTMGAQYLRSVVASEGGVFGIDTNVKKVWLVDGQTKKVVSDFRVQALLNDLVTDNIDDIVTTYNSRTYELTVSFYYSDDTTKSLIYNVMSDVWYGTSDINKFWVATLENEHLSIQKHNGDYGMYYPVTTEFDEMFRTEVIIGDELIQYNSFLEFVVRYQDLSSFYLTNITLNGLGTPSWIDVFTEVNEQYEIGPSTEDIIGVLSATVPTHTNVYMIDAVGADISRYADYKLVRNNSALYKQLDIGDKLTLQIDTDAEGEKMIQYTVAGVRYETTPQGDTTIIVDRPIPEGTALTLFYGWKVPIRVSYGEISDSKTKMVIPGRKQAEAISGLPAHPQPGYLNSSPAKPYGRWVKLRLNFNGFDPMYIDSVITDTTARH